MRFPSFQREHAPALNIFPQHPSDFRTRIYLFSPLSTGLKVETSSSDRRRLEDDPTGNVALNPSDHGVAVDSTVLPAEPGVGGAAYTSDLYGPEYSYFTR